MPKVIFEKRGPIAYITLNRPEVHNAIDTETDELLFEAWTQFRDDADIRIAILTGSGDKTFCAGADLKTHVDSWLGAGPELGHSLLEKGFAGRITRGLHRTPKPIIAALNGWVIGGGIELALACDIRIASDQAKRNGILHVLPGREARYLAPLEVRKIPGVGKVMEKNLHSIGIRRIGDLAILDEKTLTSRFGKWGLALAGKSHGLDAGGWFDSEIGERGDPKSISHEHTFHEDTRDPERLEATLTHLAEKVARRLREHNLHTRTIQLKLRYSDFTTITRARSLAAPTQLDIHLIEESRRLLHENWDRSQTIRLIGIHTSGFEHVTGQLDLLDSGRSEKWRQALEAADKLRDKYGESAVALGSGLRGKFRERVQENPAALPGKEPRKQSPGD